MREIDVPLTRQAVVCTACLINANRCLLLRYGELASNISALLLGRGEKVRKSAFGAQMTIFGASHGLKVAKSEYLRPVLRT